MGVLGLWRFLDSTGKPVPLETLEGKVLAIDVSIWIHQVIQGYQDRQGNSIPNAHLIGLFNRICKLMYFKIKPVFVFDGGVPLLKKNTIATRRKLKSIATSKARKLKNDLINTLIKHAAVKGALDKENDDGDSIINLHLKNSAVTTDSSKINDIYKLPAIPSTSKSIDSDDYLDSDEEFQLKFSPRKQTKWIGNIHNVDVNTEEFKNLPADVRYDILTDLKETRKQNSWGRIHELPAGSKNYSGFQVKRLLKRRYVQESLEDAEKEMGGKTLTLEELDKLLTDQGIKTTQQDDIFRIASDSKTRVIYMKDLDKQVTQNNEKSSDSSNLNLNKQKEQNSDSNDECTDSISIKSDNSVAVIDNMQAYDLDEDWYSDENFTETHSNDSHLLSKRTISKTVLNPALSYMLEHSGLTRDQIIKIVEQSKKNKKQSDGNSSQGSSKRERRTPNRLSLRNRSKKKKLIDSTFVDSPKIEKEILNNVKFTSESNFVEVLEKFNNKSQEVKSNAYEQSVAVESSDSESNDFEEVSEKFNVKKEEYNDSNKTMIMESSDSEYNDFVEIQDVPIPEVIDSKQLKRNNFQITIKADEELQDDIFADVFCDIAKKVDVGNENKFILDEIQDKRTPDSFEQLTEKESLILVREEVVASFSRKESNKDQSEICSSGKMQAEFTKQMLLLTPEKINPNIGIHNDYEISLNINNSAEATIVTEAIPESKIIETNIETKGNEIHKNNHKDLIVDNFTSNSQLILKSNSMQQFTNIKTQKEEKEETTAVLSKISPSTFPVDEKELESMKKQLELDQQQIFENLGKLERQATDITDQMRLEAQELLKLFGIPYIVAPMEAEAQCAYLEQIKLTDGTITDDSDIWLFGGQCVYKNFFDNNKKVLQFLSNDIKHHFKLSRKEMIQLALLVGSDYTNGLIGVGPVTALEILAAFPSDGEDILRGLRAFSIWLKAGKLAAPEKATLRNKLKNIQIERGFPSQAVVQAYICPIIDESKEAFTWGKPNLILLADYVKKKFGWTKFKFEEIITPVMKKLNESKSQKTIDSYFKVQSVPKSIEASLSKRVQTAVQRLGDSSQDLELSDNEMSTNTKQKFKKSRKLVVQRAKKFQNESSDLLPIIETNEDESQSQTTQDTNATSSDINIKIMPKKIVNIVEDIIPQKEQDKANALKSKLRAIEIFRKSKKGLDRAKKSKKVVKKIKEEAELSESSSSS